MKTNQAGVSPTFDQIHDEHDFHRAARLTETWLDPRPESAADRSAKATRAYIDGQIRTIEELNKVLRGEK